VTNRSFGRNRSTDADDRDTDAAAPPLPTMPDQPSFQPSADLAGRCALVTGGGRGLGREMARHLAAAGAAVAVVARSPGEVDETVALITDTGGRAISLLADVTEVESIERAVDAAERALGPLDLLVNNAGHAIDPGPVWEADPDEWWRVQEVNVRGAFLGTRAALARMVPRGRGRVINVSSRSGNVAPAFASAYATSKTALTRFTEIVAAEARPHGVFVFALEPGTVLTPMTRRLIESEAGRRWLPWYLDIFDSGRDATPDEGARLVVRLASGAADALAGRFLSRADDLDALVRDADAIARDERLVLRLRS
jgi:NAD(P)-dependent dehydrogenase (short-subunit alcohol dehydrogenase family)